MANNERSNKTRGDPFGPTTLVPIVIGIIALGVGGLYSASTGTVLGIMVGIVLAALLWAYPFISGRVTLDNFRHSPETVLIGSDDRLSSPYSERKYQYLVDGELRDAPPHEQPAQPSEQSSETRPGEARE